MNIDQAVHEAAQATDAQLRKTYGVALARGATNTGCMPEQERLYGTLRLLTLATLRLPDLAMIAQLLHIAAAADDPVVLCAAHDVAGALRLAHRALETHGRDLGYEIDAWIDDALLLAGVELAREHDRVAPSSTRNPTVTPTGFRRQRAAQSHVHNTLTEPALPPPAPWVGG